MSSGPSSWDEQHREEYWDAIAEERQQVRARFGGDDHDADKAEAREQRSRDRAVGDAEWGADRMTPEAIARINAAFARTTRIKGGAS